MFDLLETQILEILKIIKICVKEILEFAYSFLYFNMNSPVKYYFCTNNLFQ